MNRVYKVIWSKAKHCYVVTSEIAKGYGKSAGSKGVKVLLSGLVALSIAMGGYGLADAVFVDSRNASEGTYTTEVYTTAEVYTRSETGDKFATKDELKAKANADDVASTYTKNEDFEKLKGIVGEGQEDGNYVAKGETLSASINILDTQVKTNADAVGQETLDRKLADKDNLKVGNDGVISKVTGDDGTTSSAVNKLVLNKDGDKQITMDEKGIKVGKNSTTMDENGFYAGSDYNYGTAKAALDATEGKIRGADGNFQVNANGQVTAKGGVDTDGGEILTRGGSITAGKIIGTELNTQGGAITGGMATVTGLTTQGGAINAGAISGGSLSVTGTMEGNSLKLNGGNLDAGSGIITTNGNIKGNNITADGTITTKNLEVTDGFKTDHITLGSDGLNQTDINKGNVTSIAYKNVGTVGYMAESIFNEDGSSITVRTNEGGVDSIGNSTVGGKEISQYLGSNAGPDPYGKNVTRRMVRNDDGTFSMLDTAVDGKDKYSTVSQNAGSLISSITDSANKTSTGVTQTATDITNTANNGTIANEAKDITNHATGNMTNTVDNKLDTTVGGEMNTTVTGNVTEDYKSDLDTTVGGNETRTVEGTLKETVTGDVTEDYKANLTTTVTGDSSLSAENINNTANDALINEAVTITNKAHESVTTQIGNGTTVKSVMDVNGIANTASTGTITNYAVTITNTGVASVTNQVSDNKVLVDTNQVKSAFGDTIYTTWDADGITNITGNNTVISDNGGTTFANEDAKTPFAEGGKTGTRVNTKITGNKVETGKVLTDFAEVANNLDVKGSTTTGTLRVEKDGYVGGDLNVEGNIETHDAVLSADSRQVVTGRQLYQTNERVDRLDNRIKKVGANAAALAALRPGDFNPDDKFSIAAGFGSYRNANAAALGLFYRPNENVLLSLGTSFGDGENMVNAGVSVKFGRGKSMAERRKEMADEVSSMRDEMRSQDERIAELEEMLKKQSELIEKLSKES